MNRNDYIEQKKRESLKSEACDWESHIHCNGFYREKDETHSAIHCVCNCHDIVKFLAGTPIEHVFAAIDATQIKSES